jgi:hypothetical protein
MVSKLRARDASFRNEILCALPDSEINLLRPHLKQVALKSGEVLHEPNSPIKDVFFVEKGVVSLTADTHDHGQVEVGLTGREGLVGASVILNPKSYSVHRAFSQAEGYAYRLSSTVQRSAVGQSATLPSQAAACNARHNLPERLARWLLMVRDRIDSDDLPMTQEFLS